MGNLSGKRRKLTKIALGLGCLAIALLGSFFGYCTFRWHGMMARADRIQDHLDLQDSTRPVLWGRALPGDAWQDYSRAIEALSGDAEHDWIDYQTACRETSVGAARPRRDALLALNRAALVDLQDGAHRQRSRMPIEWHLGYQGGAATLLSYRTLANLAVLEGERYLDLNQAGPAVELFLDIMQLGRDHLQTPRMMDEMFGAALLGIGLEALIERGNLDRLGSSQLATLALGLRSLDENIPELGKSLQGELLLFARTLASSGLLEAWEDMVTWRWGFSYQLLSADHAEQSSAHAKVYADQANMSWPEARPRLLSSYQALLLCENPISREQAVDLVHYGSIRRHVIAKLRMLRMVVAQRRGEIIRPLKDPFGGDLSYELDGDMLSIWSLGKDGTTQQRDRVKLLLHPRWSSTAKPSGR